MSLSDVLSYARPFPTHEESSIHNEKSKDKQQLHINTSPISTNEKLINMQQLHKHATSGYGKHENDHSVIVTVNSEDSSDAFDFDDESSSTSNRPTRNTEVSLDSEDTMTLFDNLETEWAQWQEWQKNAVNSAERAGFFKTDRAAPMPQELSEIQESIDQALKEHPALKDSDIFVALVHSLRNLEHDWARWNSDTQFGTPKQTFWNWLATQPVYWAAFALPVALGKIVGFPWLFPLFVGTNLVLIMPLAGRLRSGTASNASVLGCNKQIKLLAGTIRGRVGGHWKNTQDENHHPIDPWTQFSGKKLATHLWSRLWQNDVWFVIFGINYMIKNLLMYPNVATRGLPADVLVHAATGSVSISIIGLTQQALAHRFYPNLYKQTLSTDILDQEIAFRESRIAAGDKSEANQNALDHAKQIKSDHQNALSGVYKKNWTTNIVSTTSTILGLSGILILSTNELVKAAASFSHSASVHPQNQTHYAAANYSVGNATYANTQGSVEKNQLLMLNLWAPAALGLCLAGQNLARDVVRLGFSVGLGITDRLGVTGKRPAMNNPPDKDDESVVVSSASSTEDSSF